MKLRLTRNERMGLLITTALAFLVPVILFMPHTCQTNQAAPQPSITVSVADSSSVSQERKKTPRKPQQKPSAIRQAPPQRQHLLDDVTD